MKKLNWIEIISLYIGVIMGAGFASGRECWQFFGVFGNKGYYGAAAATVVVGAVGDVLFGNLGICSLNDFMPVCLACELMIR